MKVILLKDVARLGRKHEVKDVPDGHAQNYLLPRKLVEIATPQNLKRIEERASHIAEGNAAVAGKFKAFLDERAGAPIVIEAAANPKGGLFSGVRAVDVAAALSRESGIAFTASSVELPKPIKEAGEYTVSVTAGGVRMSVVINVKAK
jgi:large subunit ribosomal protein L9